ncbi:MAG: hypothetical protein NTX00_01975 [Candidatus Parcubacteria bacterium]|nr:hypothetical protein [Candidatus Parcubacteria bacterium]
MFKNNELPKAGVEQNPALSKVRNFCKNFTNGSIIPLDDGYFFAQRLNGKGEQVGVYLFDKFGNIQEFKGRETDFRLFNQEVDYLEKNLAKLKILTVGKEKVD